jgi:hypothetical protein
MKNKVLIIVVLIISTETYQKMKDYLKDLCQTNTQLAAYYLLTIYYKR